MTSSAQLGFVELMAHSVLELILSSILLFGVTTIVRFVMGPSPISRVFPQIHVQLFIAGTAVALLLAGLSMSPPGKASGGHMNPAISFAVWRFRVIPGPGFMAFIVGQVRGTVVWRLRDRAALGPSLPPPPVCVPVFS